MYIVRFAPSACNTQPWVVEVAAKELKVYRYKKSGKRGIMPINKVIFYNKIDIGIFLLFMDVVLKHENIEYKRDVFNDSKEKDEIEKTLVAIYHIK